MEQKSALYSFEGCSDTDVFNLKNMHIHCRENEGDNMVRPNQFGDEFGKRYWNLIRDICLAAYPNSVSSDEVIQEFRKRDGSNPDWKEKMVHKGEEMTDNVYEHEIRYALYQLKLNNILTNPSLKMYRFLKDEDRGRSLLDPEEVWVEVQKNAMIAAQKGTKIPSNRKGQYRREYKIGLFNGVPEVFDISPNYSYSSSTGKHYSLRFDVVKQIVDAVNANNGRVQQGWRILAQRSAVVYCCDSLSFDEEGWIVFGKNNQDEIFIGETDEVLVNDQLLSPHTAVVTVEDLVQQAKSRAKGGTFTTERNRKEIPFSLDDDWIQEKETLTHCEVTGIPFSNHPGPFARSLDQIVAGQGYTPNNVNLVVRIYNFAKNDFSSEDVEEFCRMWHLNKFDQ